nr:immunoglobulin heavy chain junction region [Mus musculus]NSM03881.1 immunoglobulin heavy chain junction region [Mus musculus]NSM04428.1 immunoglobulin heavy chain junction region [Mus musculus]NSM04721.1 immunoglobulin heavy chain junction region [Mus musculus]NSM06495.1 immunoglobulin heavy chain junction region [Mus musculus]
CARFSNLFAYW